MTLQYLIVRHKPMLCVLLAINLLLSDGGAMISANNANVAGVLYYGAWVAVSAILLRKLCRSKRTAG